LGFSAPSKSTGKTTETKFFKAGSYRIRAELEQIKGKPLAQGNPMALAVNITSASDGGQVISEKSWNQNPMGIALTIDAPLPPIPQEPIIEQEGRCPRNPIWTTRYPGSSERWYPVRFGESWSRFMNRYAISPVIPLSSPGSDGGGIVYKNSWTIDIPYDGFYGLKGTVDNGGRILIDGNEIIKGGLNFGGRVVGKGRLSGFRSENPDTTKVFLTRGSHRIEVEVENEKTETFTSSFVNQKIFRTKDWIVSHSQPQQGREEWVLVDDVFNPPGQKIGSSGLFSTSGDYTNVSFHRYNEGTWYKGKRIRDGGDWNDTNVNNNYIQFDENTRLTLGTYHPAAGKRFGIAVWKKKITNTQSSASTQSTIGGVTYEGPPLFNYKNPDGTWHPFMNNASLSPVIPGPNADSDGRKRFTWRNVKFPVTGQYEINFLADNDAKLILGGKKILRSQGFGESPNSYFVNISEGTYDLVIDSEYPYNNSENNTREYFQTNPTGFALVIKKDIEVRTPVASKPWTTNPVGISAVLIPPPCPKRIRGRGVVIDVEVDDPGNGYPIPQGDSYPVSLRLKSVIVENPGINYNCGVDQIQITPSNGAVLDYECDSFGRINNVKVLNPGLGFTRYPDITIVSDTGVNVTFRPQFEVVRDPIVIDPDKLIQVTDLVGLKQTGYVDGRAYFGAVFYKDGVRYAGFYETPGELVQVYDTLQESIDAQVTTRPSAILRQGTDTNSNNPRLNLPETPENLI
jgi:hypothetical protein